MLMLAGYRFHRPRAWHASAMALCMLYDICVPFYLFFARNWPHRLIEQGEIFNFLIWMHVALDILLFALYVLQIQAGLKLWRGEEDMRITHGKQAKAILGVRALVVLSGALLTPK